MKQIKEFPSYSIDESGNIFSNKSNRQINTFIDRTHGLKKVTLFKNGKPYIRLVHRLVAEAFIPKTTGAIVAHKDNNKLNNHYSNLEWQKKKIRIS